MPFLQKYTFNTGLNAYLIDVLSVFIRMTPPKTEWNRNDTYLVGYNDDNNIDHSCQMCQMENWSCKCGKDENQTITVRHPSNNRIFEIPLTNCSFHKV